MIYPINATFFVDKFTVSYMFIHSLLCLFWTLLSYSSLNSVSLYFGQRETAEESHGNGGNLLSLVYTLRELDNSVLSLFEKSLKGTSSEV